MSKVEKGVEPGYVTVKKTESETVVLKLDLSGTEAAVLARHVVRDGQCDCLGFTHRKDCRHVQLVYARPRGVDRQTAREAAAEVIHAWEPWFSRLVFDDYLFADPDEQVVKGVRLRGRGKPVIVEGVEHKRIVGIHDKTFVELLLEV
jgi:hypothetical protein